MKLQEGKLYKKGDEEWEEAYRYIQNNDVGGVTIWFKEGNYDPCTYMYEKTPYKTNTSEIDYALMLTPKPPKEEKTVEDCWDEWEGSVSIADAYVEDDCMAFAKYYATQLLEVDIKELTAVVYEAWKTTPVNQDCNEHAAKAVINHLKSKIK